MKKVFKIGTSVLALGTMVACGSGETPSPWNDKSKQIVVCLASEPDSIDPALNSTVDGSTMLVHLESGLKRYAHADEGKTAFENDLAEKIEKTTAEVKNHEPVYKKDEEGKDTDEIDHWEEKTYTGGVRYTVTLRDDIYWSNHNYEKLDKITSDDFIYSWNRASGSSLAADYAYMFEGIADGFAHEMDDEQFPSLGLKKIDDRTFTIDLPVVVPYFEQLFAFPTFFPVHKATVEKYSGRGAWAAESTRYVSSGAYVIKEWRHNSKIVLEKNPNYWNADNIKCEKITFALSDSDAAMYASFKSGEYDLIDTIPQEQIDEIKREMGNKYHCESQLATYYISFNMNSTSFNEGKNGYKLTEQDKADVRIALAKLINRKHLVEQVTKADQTPSNAFVDEGITDYDGNKFVAKNGPEGDGSGYFKKGLTSEELTQNQNEAIETLKKFYTNKEGNKFEGIKFKYLYNTGTGHQSIAQYIHDEYANYGIEMTMQNEEWNSFLNTRKKGNYDVARNGWNADYDDAYTYLSMWLTNSGNNDSQFGRGDHEKVSIYEADIDRNGQIGEKEKNLTWKKSYDVLIDLSNKESDPEKRSKLLHEAETLLMSTGGICPLYNYTDLYLLSDTVSGMYTTPLGYKFFYDCVRTK